ncbi:bifunctional diaminohydroxyphosphoribosylaminopyrimidine deaminase/5-amino-6-(5-phosphoribosylamino)uracil reductase RibD [Dyella sp.]|uniref:bifunctional diaminohydroxyphosphoribosylaminopyrimidine deaminase/5-amino-6-(5-phosphoribosylamino)uracil reductase RibD n=1 Tax=Dyella sp. TaxID=1869338 RepID=UPI002D76BE02|nr:bifunctional diaminohydroxyphosphoribosylaminopyrimidine deaminase/5-amino-6-(5-phosphoribosylamino)uracil reductase RibD [Dyella sp.]HET6433283.1 bifunctional diaminohydroxyphosphoribosylaminopyrimidine deaminase/5-amino-6-(5-phosphoribosylamino)uracil reductase RibD [Dyella sp.]
MPFSAIDHAHMARALALAERGLFTTQPNPRVGCVIAHGDAVVGEGWHWRAGGPHAEVVALRDAGGRSRDATAYVTLEPCGLQGRTPPCADALIAAGVARVVIAAEDTSQAEGAGLARLRAAGIAIETGLMREPARELNVGFFRRIETGRPFVRLKLAMSLDGRTALANGASQWITGEAARADVQRWRARSSAILTGSGTALADNPRLTVRLASASGCAGTVQGEESEGRQAPHAPLRVVLDRALRTPAGSHLLDGAAPTLVLHGAGAMVDDERFAGVERATVPVRDGRLDLAAVLALLAARQVNEVHVEAGPVLGGALLAAGLVDELLLYVAPVLLGDTARPLLQLPNLLAMTDRWQLRTVEQRSVGINWRLRLRPG